MSKLIWTKGRYAGIWLANPAGCGFYVSKNIPSGLFFATRSIHTRETASGWVPTLEAAQAWCQKQEDTPTLEAWREMALRLARHVRNTDSTPTLASHVRGMEMLVELRAMDPAAYDAEVKP